MLPCLKNAYLSFACPSVFPRSAPIKITRLPRAGGLFGAPAVSVLTSHVCLIIVLRMSRSVSLKLEEGWPTRDHAHYVRHLIGAGVNADDIKQIDLHGRAGMCVVTVSCQAVRDSIASKGLSIDGRPVEMVISSGTVVSLHVFGVEDDLSLAAIVQGVEKFGSVVGPAKREKKSVDGCTFTTGTVYVNVALRAVVPSLIAIGSRNRKYRVWHKDQQQTCWKCGSTGHLAKDCTNARTKDSRRASTGSAEQAEKVIVQAHGASLTFAEAAGQRNIQPDAAQGVSHANIAVENNATGTPDPGASSNKPVNTSSSEPVNTSGEPEYFK